MRRPHHVARADEGSGEEVYRGQAGYQKFNERKETFAGNAYKGVMQIGV